MLIGNLLGSLFVAYFLAVQSGVLTDELPLARLGDIATKKAIEETEWQIFLRAVGCNWLVCLAVWMAMAADDIAGKVLAIFFPIMAFVAMGFDHVVANMFFIPAAIFADVDDITWGDALHNWIFAFLGNLVGAAIFVALSYWYLYGRERGEAGEPSRASRATARPSLRSARAPEAAPDPLPQHGEEQTDPTHRLGRLRRLSRPRRGRRRATRSRRLRVGALLRVGRGHGLGRRLAGRDLRAARRRRRARPGATTGRSRSRASGGWRCPPSCRRGRSARAGR